MSFCSTLKRYFAALWPFGNKNVKPPTRRKDTSVQEGLSMISGSSSKLPPCSEVDNGTGDSNLPLSVITVLSIDDLLIEILLRLPVVSLHLFKSVSKHWLSLITSPNFTLTRSQIPNIDPSLGLLALQDVCGFMVEQPFEYDFVSFDIRIPTKRSTVFTFSSEAPPGSVKIMQSCNGLFLCSIQKQNYSCYSKYYVYNPTTKLFKMLPIESHRPSVKMAFDPTKSPHYKVIHVGPSNQIETYCSETCNLSVHGDRFHDHYFTRFEDGIYWNDAIHWLGDSYPRTLHCKLEIVNEHPVLQDYVIFDGKYNFQFKLFESRGSLLLLCEDEIQLTTCEMRNGYSRWSVKYIVNLNDLSMPFPSISRIWSIVLGEKDEDSFMIIDLRSKVVQYNPVLKTVSDLKIGTSHRYLNVHGFQFIASFAGV